MSYSTTHQRRPNTVWWLVAIPAKVENTVASIKLTPAVRWHIIHVRGRPNLKSEDKD